MSVFEYTGNGQSVPKNVVSVRFHPSVVSIDDGAFEYCCTHLREVVLNDGLKNIGDNAFRGCSLDSITLPSTVVEVGTDAFLACDNLRGAVLNEGLQKIGTLSFIGCDALESITLPSTLISIDAGAFYSCRNLREVAMNGISKKIGNNVFGACPSLERVTLPKISSRLDNMLQTGHYQRVEAKMDEVRGTVERRGSDLSVTVAAIDFGHNWDIIKRSLRRIIKLITYYEIKEATTLFELAMWKVKMGQVKEANNINREACRIEVPGPVKNTILQYLWS